MLDSTIVRAGSSLSPELEKSLAGYRYDIFVRQLGWKIPTACADDGLERDQFDDESTIYVIRQDSDGSISGCARLLPTTQPYLLESVFPNLFGAGTPPKSRIVWEMSRLSVSMGDNSAMKGLKSVLRAAVLFGLENGIERYISVSYVSMERLLRRLGLHTHRAGLPELIDGKPVVAFWVDLDQITLKALDCFEVTIVPDLIFPQLK